jgi:formaldehyde-activating enzyme involved in methanogenesis
MTSNSDGKFLSRFVAVVLVGLAFAASLAMVAQGERPLFAETSSAAVATATEVADAQ